MITCFFFFVCVSSEKGGEILAATISGYDVAVCLVCRSF